MFYLLALFGKKYYITKREGIVMLAIYILFVLTQIFWEEYRCNGQFVVLKTSVCVSMTAFSCPFLNMNLKNAHNVAVKVLKKMVKTDKAYKGTGVENVIKDSNLQSEIQIQYWLSMY